MNKSVKPQIDWFIFFGGTLILLAAVVPIVVAPEWSFKMVNAAFSFLTQQFGVYYIIAACTIVVFLLWISISDFGRTVLGPDGVAPSHSKPETRRAPGARPQSLLGHRPWFPAVRPLVPGWIAGTSDRLCGRLGTATVRLYNPRMVDREGNERTLRITRPEELLQMCCQFRS